MKLIKEFLKPDWKKIILSVLIIFTFLLLRVYSTCLCSRSPPPTCLEKIYYLPWEYCCPTPICGTPDFLLSIKILFYAVIASPIDIPTLFLHIIFWYFLSCFIVWVYDKVKKR